MLVAKQSVGTKEKHDALTPSIAHNYPRLSPLSTCQTAALAAAVSALISGACLTVTALGRRLNSPARTKHNIKRMDRLMSNSHLHAERKRLYQALCHRLCQHLTQPKILVDWSDIVEQ